MANRDMKYINRDFDSFRNSLIQFSQNYFPNTYNDFSANSPGSLFIEMASYVGDVLSFYLDNQVQETFLQYARQEPNLYDLAYMMGYRPKATGAATVEVEIYQQVPAILSGGEYVPDYNYALFFEENTTPSTYNNAEQIIREELALQFPEVQLKTIEIFGEPERNILQVVMSYTVFNNEEDTVEINLTA